MNDPAEIVDRIIRQNLVGADAGAALPLDKSFAEIGLSSFGLMRGLLQIEQELGIKVVTPKTVRHLKTLGDLHALFAA